MNIDNNTSNQINTTGTIKSATISEGVADALGCTIDDNGTLHANQVQTTGNLVPQSQGVCPACGYCPCCGRRGYGFTPYPYWPYYGTWTVSGNTGDFGNQFQIYNSTYQGGQTIS